MPELLLTGFTPFDGRDINASWVAAQSYADAHHLEIPVVWGQPMGFLQEKIAESRPSSIISMGEGREGWFDIETRARNDRKHRIDNHKAYPAGPILPGHVPAQFASIDTRKMFESLQSRNLPIRISQDAGQFLCEETLYCLETLKQEHEFIQQVTFVHLPPFGTRLDYQGETREVDAELLADFVVHLVEAVLSLKGTASSSLPTENHG